ncbi:hypothetical protein WMY93_024748 [Mugilogobius chulae]|uniref:C2H2-type domain-containing protein n=1 Tax=Mugilogobius chulae TaxID=88201 RepID=A0AAW0N260_9GOBI
MSKVPVLRALMQERLTAAAEEIFALVEKTFAEFEAEMCRSKEIPPLRRVHRHSAGVQTELFWESPNVTSDSSFQQSLFLSSTPQTEAEDEVEAEEVEAEEAEESEESEESVETPGGLITSDTEGHYGTLESPYSCPAQETEVEKDEIQTNEESVETDGQIPSVLPKPKMRRRRRTHVTVCTLKQKHQCPVCLKTLKGNVANLQRHMVVHTGERPYSCSVCQKTFAQQYLLKKHMEMHQEEEQRAQGTQTSIQDVQKTEVDDHLYPFGCSICIKRFKRQATLKNHMENHETTKPKYKRLVQAESSVVRDEKQAEVKEQEEEVPEFDLEKTGAEYTQATLMKTMHAASATAPELEHRCSVCHRTFTTRTRLKRHMIVHTGDKPFSCPVCNKCFSQKYNVRIHMAVHTNEKPYTCEICLKSYRRNDDLRTHTAAMHTGQILFSCVFVTRGSNRGTAWPRT